MNCRRIQNLIPLYVEGDLERAEAGPVRSHLESCPECARAASDFRASQQWLRSYVPPDFEGEFFDGLRGAVLKEIEESRARPSRFSLRIAWNPAPLALASALVFGMFFGLALYAYSSMSRGLAIDEIPPYLRGDADPMPLPGLDTGAPSEIKSPRPFIRAARAKIPVRPTQRRTLEREPVAATLIKAEPARETLRIEFQTGDPNIRIIWFAPTESTTGNMKLMTRTETEQEINHVSD